MKRQHQLPGGEAATNFRRGRERRHAERRSLAAGGDQRDELPAAVREPLVFTPCSRVAGNLLPLPFRGCLGRRASHRKQIGGERRPHLGRGIEHGREFGMTGQHRGPSCGICPRQAFRVGAEQRFDRRASATERLADQPTAADGGLAGVERGVAAASGGRCDPCLEGLGPRRAQPDERTEWIDGRITRRRVAEQLREQQIGLPIGNATEAGHQHFHQPRCLKERRRASPCNRDGAVEFPIAARHITVVVGGQRHGVGLLRAGKPAAGFATHQAAVDLCQARRRRLRVACHGQSFRLKPKERCPQDWERCPRPLRTTADRWRHAPRPRGQMGRDHQPKRLLERPHIAIVCGGVGGLLEIAGGGCRLVAIKGNPSQHDQSPGRQRMVELIPNEQTAGEQRLCLIRLALRPKRRAEGDVDPRLRIMVGGGGPSQQGLGRLVDGSAFAGEFAKDHTAAVERHHERTHDLLRPDRIVDRRREHPSFLQHLVRIGTPEADRNRAGNASWGRVALTAAPRRHPLLHERPRSLRWKLNGEQPLGMGGRKQQGLVIGGDRFAQTPQFVVAFTDDRGAGDRIDPPLRSCANSPLMLTDGNFQTVGEIARRQRGEREVVSRRRHRLASGHAKTRLKHDLRP